MVGAVCPCLPRSRNTPGLPSSLSSMGALLSKMRRTSTSGSRVAHTLSFMYAPHERAQHRCQRVLSVACAGFLSVADIKGDVGATRVSRKVYYITARKSAP